MSLKKLVVTTIIGLFSGTLWAQDFYKAIQEHMDDLQQIRSATARDTKSLKCINRYNNLMKDGTLNIVVAFGYSDFVPNTPVYDWYMTKGLKRALMEPCRQGLNACEFKQSKNDPNKLFKMIEDLDGKMKKVELVLIQGALTGHHPTNISPINLARQMALCQSVTARFYDEIKKGSEIVYYSGHSRDGGGPDFCPPITRADGHVDYNWYHAHKPGLKILLGALKNTVKAPQVLALHSCSSLSHFSKAVSAASPGTALMGYRKTVGMTPDFKNMFGGLDALLSFRCQKGLSESMNVDIPTDVIGVF